MRSGSIPPGINETRRPLRGKQNFYRQKSNASLPLRAINTGAGPKPRSRNTDIRSSPVRRSIALPAVAAIPFFFRIQMILSYIIGVKSIRIRSAKTACIRSAKTACIRSASAIAGMRHTFCPRSSPSRNRSAPAGINSRHTRRNRSLPGLFAISAAIVATAAMPARSAKQYPKQSSASIAGIARAAVIAEITGLTRPTGIKTSVAHSMKSSCVFEGKPHTVLYVQLFFFVL